MLPLQPTAGAVQRLVLEFSLPSNTDLKTPEGIADLNAWILGRVADRSYRTQEQPPALWLEFQPLAVIKRNA